MPGNAGIRAETELLDADAGRPRRAGGRGGGVGRRPRGRRPRGAAGGRARRRAGGQGRPGVRAPARARAARGLEGVRQGDHAGGRRPDRRALGRPHGRRGDGGDRVLPGGDQGRRPRRGQGRGDRPGRGRGARGAGGDDRGAALRRPPGAGRGVPRAATSCPCSRCATASARSRSRPARDFKRIGDGDTGPNTGGMGAFSPVKEIHAPLLARSSRPSTSRCSTSCATAGRRSTACSTPG